MCSVDYASTRGMLDAAFAAAEAALLANRPPQMDSNTAVACEALFSSRTQAYREVLLGCTLARLHNKTINIRQPYRDQGPASFAGRSLDERVVNPFLHDNRIPSSRGPYLSVFRRSVQFDASTRFGLRDKDAYDAFLHLIARLESASNDAELHKILVYLLYKFAELREASAVPLSQLQPLSLDQYRALFSGLLNTPSGGRLPVLLVVTTLQTICDFFGLDWRIDYQGINVADAARGAGGDITVSSSGETVMAAEVTERAVDRSRVVTTFNSKIAPSGIEDYLFFLRGSGASEGARQQAHQYFAQGHDVNFLEITEWMCMVLATVGKRGRAMFNVKLRELLDAPDVPAALRVAWNAQVARLTGSV